MNRPADISNEDISRWSYNINNDPNIPKEYYSNLVIRELLYAGLWLNEQLFNLNCSEELIQRILFTAGKMSFGQDFWKIHQQMLDDYKNNALIYENE